MVNVFSAKVAINGIVHILLIALKDIKKMIFYIMIITPLQINIQQIILFIKKNNNLLI